ncbi:DUF1800 domain-containing protein [Frigoriglobus tundricola]|uniref:DUF1800 domain-containing protein n=1 Tax=Frigoriglobus tundricola TaxID=2774151 RepID=A0A6M5YR02_9BACT|nr:DUF1800 domain-containing protein [Frigoriglobus tundricola]QJW95894.1 hypothetical protein FTUN_3448 [Frigoriglobus tundricola]
MAVDPKTAWQPYTPRTDAPWDRKAVGHLYRRAGFGATAAELDAGVKDGPAKALDRVLTGASETDDFTRTSDFMASARSMPTGAPQQRLSAWWIDRMLKTRHPLREKMTLFWHNHFATSNAKVLNARFMLGQYRLIQTHALGCFADLLTAMGTDPAMLVWLDTNTSTKAAPNENYAREVMELFSLGVGNYTETDIREAAKAFTGYEIRDGKGALNPRQHDAGEKTVFGKKGAFTGEDVAKLCLDHPACPRFIVRKLYRFLVSDTDTPPAELIDPLAEEYRASGFNTGTLVSTILRSNVFFSPTAYRAKIKSPVEFVVGTVRTLEGGTGALPLADALDSLGQVLFAPPSVKGWDGGPAWLNAQTLLGRNNIALALTSTEDGRFGARCDPAELLAKHGIKGDAETVDFLLGLFLQGDAPPATRNKLLDYLRSTKDVKYPAYWTGDDLAAHRTRAVTHLALTLPEYQLN